MISSRERESIFRREKNIFSPPSPTFRSQLLKCVQLALAAVAASNSMQLNPSLIKDDNFFYKTSLQHSEEQKQISNFCINIMPLFSSSASVKNEVNTSLYCSNLQPLVVNTYCSFQ